MVGRTILAGAPRYLADVRWRLSGVVAVLALTACSSAATGHSAPQPLKTTQAPAATAVVNPDALIGLWGVTAAAGEPSGTVLRLSSGEVFGAILFRSCGEVSGSWAASVGGTFIAMTDGWSEACSTTSGKDPTPSWLTQARTYRVRGGQRDLLAPDGTVLATLLPGGRPHVSADILPALRATPTLDTATVLQLRKVPKPLPAATTAATNATIAGRWVPYPARHAVTAKAPILTFTLDGDWRSQVGCGLDGGRFTVGAGGWLLTLAGPSAAVACAGTPVSNWISTAKRAAVAGKTLTFYASDGTLVARLTR
jgi:hypothetical protein